MTQTLVDFIKAHALAHYEDGGWDVIVECYGDEEIAETLADAGAITETEALQAFAYRVDVWADRQAEARYQGQD